MDLAGRVRGRDRPRWERQRDSASQGAAKGAGGARRFLGLRAARRRASREPARGPPRWWRRRWRWRRNVQLAVPLMSESDCLPDTGGTLFLASVRDAAEAELAIGSGADIVDLKDPDAGALGALAPATIEACVRAVGGRVPLSATIGDLPLEKTSLRAAVLATASRGVDY